MKSEYLLVLAIVLLFPLLLSFDRNLALWKKRTAIFKSLAFTCGVFWLWDIIATARGHWSFHPERVLGFSLAGMPIEEWLFFPVLGFVSIFTWESVKYFLKERD